MQTLSAQRGGIASTRPGAPSRPVLRPAPFSRRTDRPSQGRSLHVVGAQKKKFASFEELLAGSEVPLLVDFYATWCGPCQMLAPVLSSISKRLEGQLQVVKVDSDKYQAIASKYRITALPTVILFKNGQPVDRMEGLLAEQQLFERLQYHLATK